MERQLVFFNLVNSIRKKLKEERLTLRQAAEKAKVSPPTLSKLLRGQTTPDTKTLINLSEWLQIPIDQLLQIPYQLTLDNSALQLQLEIHFRGKRKKLETYADKVEETILKMIRLAYTQFQSQEPKNGKEK